MLFPKSEDVTRVWKLVVEGVINGRLGPVAKVAPNDGSGKEERLICIYTEVSLQTDLWKRTNDACRTSGTRKMCDVCFTSLTLWASSRLDEPSTTSQMHTLTSISTKTPPLNLGCKLACIIAGK